MGRIGDILKKRRLDLDITLERAAEETMIASRYLEAIETSDFSSFPGSVYAKGFLRRYAEYLKLEEVEIQGLLVQYEAEHKKPDEEQLQIEEKTTDAQAASLRSIRTKRKNLYLYSILTVLGFLIIGGILGAIVVPFLEKEPRVSIDPSRLLSQEELNGKKLEGQQETTSRKGTALPEIKPAIKGVLLEGNAFEEVWVLVQIDSGKNKDILVKAGEKIKWDAKEKICLTMGNAGAIAWKFNSKAIGTLGKAGAAKTVLFTPEKMQTVIKKEPPAPIPSNDERNKQDTAGGLQNLEPLQSGGNATQTTLERGKEAGTGSKTGSAPKTRKEGGNSSDESTTPNTGSKQSTPVGTRTKG